MGVSGWNRRLECPENTGALIEREMRVERRLPPDVGSFTPFWRGHLIGWLPVTMAIGECWWSHEGLLRRLRRPEAFLPPSDASDGAGTDRPTLACVRGTTGRAKAARILSAGR